MTGVAVGGRVVLSVTIHAITHLERTNLLYLGHLRHLTMTGYAGEIGPYVSVMNKLHVIRKPVNPEPVDGLTRLGGILQLPDCSNRSVRCSIDLGVAEHALLDGRYRGDGAGLNVAVAECALQSQRATGNLASVYRVWERNRLVGALRAYRKTKPRTPKEEQNHPGKAQPYHPHQGACDQYFAVYSWHCDVSHVNRASSLYPPAAPDLSNNPYVKEGQDNKEQGNRQDAKRTDVDEGPDSVEALREVSGGNQRRDDGVSQ